MVKSYIEVLWRLYAHLRIVQSLPLSMYDGTAGQSAPVTHHHWVICPLVHMSLHQDWLPWQPGINGSIKEALVMFNDVHSDALKGD